MTTREQVEAEAAELYPMPAPSRAVHVRAKTVSAEQVEAATAEAHRIGYTEHNGLPKAWAEQYVRAAFKAAGFYVMEGDR